MGLIVDNFAGGGGASTGIEAALGRAVDIAINHDEEAIRMHEANHPGTRHIRNNIWQVDPRDVTGGAPVDLAWFSPDCKHFSKAKGGKPREKSIRDLAWVVVLWAQRVKPSLILLENVEEFRTWGPLCPDGFPIKERKGETFDKWCRELRKAGYKLQFRELRACDYGAPTIRKRFFMIARCDGEPIVWPEPTHGAPDSEDVLAGKRKPWRTAAEIIDWSIPCPSIFERKKPLAEKTLRRIAHGIVKFVINNPQPFIVPVTHHGSDGRSYGTDAPLHTVTGANRGEMAVVSPHVTKFRNGAVGHDASEPLATVTANSYVKRPGGSAPLGVVAAHLISTRNGERDGQAPRVRCVEDPAPTATAKGSQGAIAVARLMAAHVEQANGGPNNDRLAGRAADAPISTIATKGSQQRLVTTTLHALGSTDARTGCSHQSDRDGNDRGATGWNGLADCSKCEGQNNPADAGEGGVYPEKRVSRGGQSLRRSATPGLGSSARLDGSARTDSSQNRHQPFGWREVEQSSGEPGARDPERKPSSRLSNETQNAGDRTGGGKAERSSEGIARGGAHLRGDSQEAERFANDRFSRGQRVAAFITKYYGAEHNGQPLSDPLHTVTHQDRFGLVTVTIEGEEYVIVDIGMRMLAPRELFAAQGFPPEYIIEHDAEGRKITKTAQVAKCGNSVCPPLAEALVRANAVECRQQRSEAA